ncbi:adventurous gliding motility protein AgmC [Archangium lipolyticum]|uniref:adventurous gliding motility protein AgmC n=1 Tax=Archangium lipolyticum TaxID=2970465 RepID=UPI00214A10AF|nr:Ig-like domain-containing protein [Archangium lipolyticum]
MKTPFMKKWLAAALCVLALGATAARAEHDTFGIGTGRDGALVVSTSGTFINSYAPVTAALAVGNTSITIGACTGVSPCFTAGDLVMVYQTASLEQVPPVDLGNSPVGRWEFARLASATGSTLELTAPLVYAYAANVTQVIRVPEYSNVTINSGQSITAPAWNGSTGGIVAFLANGSVNNSGQIAASGLGFRGGQYVIDPSGSRGCTTEDEPAPSGAQKGEGIGSSRFGPTQTGRSNVANGAGGGICLKSGGGGGGNGGAGGQGGRSESGAEVGGRGGAALTYSALTHFTFGGGGGAGHGSTNTGVAGGSGGGAIFIRANQLTGTGSISASGNLGGTSASDGGGGGGAGGAIYLRFVRTADCGSVLATGGIGGNVNAPRVGPGGGGGGGRVLIQAAPGGTCNVFANGAAPGIQQDPVEQSYGAQPGSIGATTVIPTGLIVPTPPTVVTPANGSITSNRRPPITGTATANVEVIIYLDGNEIGRTTSNAAGNYTFTPTTDLADGSHTVYAVAEVEALRSLKSTTNTFTVDTAPPETEIVSGPSGFTRELNATFEFRSNEQNVTYECRLDGATSFTTCPSPVTFSNLTVGAHTLEVRARDAAGNVDETPATRTFRITEADLSLLGSGYGCSSTGRDTSLVLMGLGAFAALARRRRRN